MENRRIFLINFKADGIGYIGINVYDANTAHRM